VSVHERLAVVISTFDKPDFLRLVLDSYRHQTDLSFRIYIADDGSGKETSELIAATRKNYPVPIEHVWHENRGFRKARIHNTTIARISEPYVLFTDGDCIPLPDLVATHRRLAQENTLISGRRILISRAWTEQLCRQKRFPASMGPWFWLKHRICGDINRLVPVFLPSSLLGPPHQRLEGIRGCHLSCWHRDIVRVDGFDEIYEGWGREDSDLVARLFHAGIRRRDLRGQPVLHLWHPEEERTGLNRNDHLLEECLKEGRIRAVKGLAHLHGDARG
jgi:glycosyltransferase involved in cell wall biosynthesis